MHDAIKQMLKRFNPKTTIENIRALREIIQEIALVGLWRAKFFEEAAFYGGTALRILYGLDRFSEDLDFSLLIPNNKFSLAKYNKVVQQELSSFGIKATVSTKEKNFDSNIESAFIKANTKQEFISIGLSNFMLTGIDKNATVKIKFEVDINPPNQFTVEAKNLSEPIPISIKTYVAPDLFAGKIHALLCRNWKTNIKGRDWYDFCWFIRKKIPLNLKHLQQRMIQSGHLSLNEYLTEKLLYIKLEKKILDVDFKLASNDVRAFIKDPSILDCWSKDYFKGFLSELIILK